jgi:predicted nuclease of predicted toxin-antitoxin system
MLLGYADENVDVAVVRGLRRRGMDVVTAEDRGQRATDDEILLATATTEGRLFLTNDADLLRIHAQWMAANRHHSGIVFWKQNLPVGEAIRRVLRYVFQTTAEEAQNMVRFL